MSTYAEYAQDGVGDELESVPVRAVLGLIQDQFARSKSIKSLQNHGGGHGADKALPHGLVWEVIR